MIPEDLHLQSVNLPRLSEYFKLIDRTVFALQLRWLFAAEYERDYRFFKDQFEPVLEQRRRLLDEQLHYFEAMVVLNE